MSADAFWSVIGEYNAETIIIQFVLFIVLIATITLSYIKQYAWLAKLTLGILNLFICIVFFAWYSTEPIQKYFALPLYLICGVLFLYESRNSKGEIIQKPNKIQGVLLLLYLSYPFVSLLLGNNFPQMVTYIMPCPIVSLSIAVYAGCKRKNKLLIALLTVWGLTGIKSLFFNAYEDIILLLCGLYGAALFVIELKNLYEEK